MSDSLDWEIAGNAAASNERQQQQFQSSVVYDQRWVGKVILITGAGGQLGRAGCCYFAARGARLVAVDLNAQALEETYRECTAAVAATTSSAGTFDYKPYVCNVTDASAVQAMVDHVVQQRFKDHGCIDHLWNNAGYQGQITPILSQTADDLNNVLNVNVTGMLLVLQAVAKHMVAYAQKTTNEAGDSSSNHNNCSIVNTASVAGLRGTPAMVGYASSKAAVLAMTVCAAKEFAHVPIRVNAISPALIGPGPLWERQNDLHAAVGAPYFANTPEAVAAAKVGSVPMKRLGTAEEVVKSVAFLLSDDASYTTGINLTVDGGMAAGLKA